jgi:hypothetical protein
LGFVTCNKRFCADGEDALPAESAFTANGNKAYNDYFTQFTNDLKTAALFKQTLNISRGTRT